ncbi:hypothetical protein ABZ883_17385 [Streptomyces sp. NPDC046977]|uniref:hypothetical protein n=1 Tax=Streptomyces sp. NPDC046977 TaxID=3154703 RepID=UPI0034024D19
MRVQVGDGVEDGGGGGALAGVEAGPEEPEPPPLPPGAVGGPEVVGFWLTAPDAVAVGEPLPLAEGLDDVEALDEAEAEAEEASDAGFPVTLAVEEACAEDVAPGEALGLGTSSEPADWVRSPVT